MRAPSPDFAAAIAALRADPAYAALARSFDVYWGDPAHDEAMDKLYRRFVPEGGLAFDIGAHVGDRTAAFRRLGARVLALEPQPVCNAALRAIFAGDPGVVIKAQACAAEPGEITFHVNSANPTVSTASAAFVGKADGQEGWREQRWDTAITVEATTLAGLIALHGRPDFVKIDVEGFEDAVLATLDAENAPAALSFEFTTIERDVAARALAHLDRIGGFVFDYALGESQKLAFGPGAEIGAARMAEIVAALPHDANSGDIYAIRRER